MKRINLRGEIVSPMYDCDFFAEWIDKGIICPSSLPIVGFESVADGEDVSVFVDTPGGDVFAGDGVIIAALAARKRCGAFSVEVGSEACSMGAFFVAAAKAAGAVVRCHSNSKVMFHSASVDAHGGAALLSDRAALVEKINQAVKANLASLGVSGVDDWFAEGREKWLGADDLLALGLVDEVIESPADPLDIAEGVSAFRAAALKRAEDENWEARFKGASRKINELTAERDSLKAEYAGYVATAEEKVAALSKSFSGQLEEKSQALAAASAKVSDLTASLNEMTKALSAKEEELGVTADALAKAREHVSRLESARQLLTAGVLTPTAGLSYRERLAAEPTAEGRERLRALKKAGKIQ